MRATTRILLSTAFLALFPCAAQSQTTYRVRDLGTLPGHQQCWAYGVNDAGEVVGDSYDVTTNTRTAFRWQAGVMTDLGHLTGGVSSTALRINASGQIAGQSDTSDGFHSHTYAMIEDGGMTALLTILDRNTFGRAINDAGTVVGGGLAAPFQPLTATVWSGGGVTSLGGLITDGGSEAFGINTAGVVVGHATTFDGLSYWHHAFEHDGTSMTDLGTFGGPTGYSRATDVNDLGQIVGWAEDRTQPTAYSHAFLYDGGMLTDLGAILNLSWANAINDAGLIVGAGNSGALYSHAFVWEGMQLHDLNDLIVPANHGWTLVEARDVSDTGFIVGYGFPPGGVHLHAFRLDPLRFRNPVSRGRVRRP